MIKEQIISLFKGETQGTFVQLFRYAFVGGAAFIVDFGTLYLLTNYLGIHYLVSATISFILGLATNYILSIVWVFNNSKLQSRFWEFVIFAIIGVIGLGLNALIMYIATDLCSIHYLLSKIISTIIVFFWNFFARKIILFKAQKKV